MQKKKKKKKKKKKQIQIKLHIRIGSLCPVDAFYSNQCSLIVA